MIQPHSLTDIKAPHRPKEWRRKAAMTGIFLLFVIPLTFFLYVEFREIDGRIDLTRKERVGVAFNGSLRRLLEDLMQHRGVSSAYLSGDASFKETHARGHLQIEDDIRAVESLNQRYGTLLKTDAGWNSFRKRWQDLGDREDGMTAEESFEGHTSLISDIIAMISHVGESSNLILDPEVSTHYLMECITFRLPAVLENLGKARSIGARVAIVRALSEDERKQLIMISALTRSAVAVANERTQRLFLSAPNLKPQLEDHVKEFNSRIKYFLDAFDREIINSREISVRPADYYETATNAIISGYKLYDKKSPALDKLLKDRIYGYRTEKFLFGSVSAVISAIFVYVFLAFARNHTRLEIAEEGLRHQVEFERLITSISSAFINFSTSDTDRTINEALQRMGEFAEADRSYVFLFSDDSSRMDNAYEWCAEGTEPAAKKFKSLKVSYFPWSTRKLKDFEIVHIKNADDFPSDAGGEKELFLARGIKSFVLVPMMNRERVIGFLGFDSVSQERRWMESDIELLKTVGNILVNTLERREADQRLVRLAVTDPLTQIYNRLKFNNALEIEIARARRHKRVFSLLMFDIDHFKDINDSFGHEVGDETLKTLTNIVSGHVRVTDTFARWGGEEFVILVVETPAEGGGIFAEKLRKQIEETSFGIAGRVTCSFGVTQFKVTDDITGITKRVDEALYEAKRSGRNRVCVR